MAGDEGHQARLRDDAGKGAARAEDRLKRYGTREKRHKRNYEMAGGQAGYGRDVEGHTEGMRKLAGDQASGNSANGPAGFQETQAACACVQDVVGQGY